MIQDRAIVTCIYTINANTNRDLHVPYAMVSKTVGCVAQLVERRFLTGELSLSCARLTADG